MAVHELTNAPGWTLRLATLLESAQDNDTIIVPSANMADLARIAAMHMNKSQIRIVTKEAWSYEKQND